LKNVKADSPISGVAKLFFTETKAKSCGSGDHQDSGSQLAKPAGAEKETLETVGQTQDLPVKNKGHGRTHSLLYRT